MVIFFINLLGFLAVLVRQNNIIWINLFPLSHVIERFIFVPFIFNKEDNSKINDVNSIKNPSEKNIYNKIKNKYKFFSEIKRTFLDYVHVVVLDILFISFIIFNKMSIVLGDKQNHDLVLHLAQINHFLIFSLFFFPYVNVNNFFFLKKNFYNLIIKNLIFVEILKFAFIISIFSLIIFAFNKFNYIHINILSDNRHYSFYYFKDIYSNLYLRFIILSYVSFTYSILIYDNLFFLRNSYFLAYIVCTLLAIVPAKLFEFRYFSPCYTTFLLILHSYFSNREIYSLIVNKINISWSIVNVLILYVFIFQPRISSENPQKELRFMW